jgi:hypothetical protein
MFGMHTIIFALGAGLAVIGIGALGFGALNSGFGVGNALIVAGAVGIAGGAVLVALSFVVQHLQQIVQALEMQLGKRLTGSADTDVRITGELPAIVSSVAIGGSSLLSGGPLSEQDRIGEGEPKTDASDTRTSKLAQESRRDSNFDAIWSNDTLPPQPIAEPTDLAPQEEITPPIVPSAETKTDEPAPDPAPSAEPSVRILKSGVIEGMAYTLYTDGSIEAELPQGTMRFATIEELRVFLDNAAG